MSDHEWCRDVRRDEQVRAAEDAAAVPAIQHRDLPEQVALVWASLGDLIGRVVRLEGEFDAGQDEEAAPAVCDSASPAEGMRTERVTLEVTHRANRDACRWPWHRVCNLQPSESVRVVDTHAEAVAESVAWEGARDAYRGCIARMAAERDSARAECERLRACADPFGEEMAVIAAWERCAITANWPADEPETAVRCAASMEREIVRLRARVAELEAAAVNAGGDQQEPVAWAELLGRLAEWDHMTTAADGPYWIGEIKKVLSGAAAPPPRGWLTAEERDLIAGLTDDDVFTEEGQNIAKALLAREKPPRVRKPHLDDLESDEFWVWESACREWIAAIRAAGGEVEG